MPRSTPILPKTLEAHIAQARGVIAKLYAEQALGDATALFFNPARTDHAMTVFRTLSEGEVVDGFGRQFAVTWGEMAPVPAPKFDPAFLERLGLNTQSQSKDAA